GAAAASLLRSACSARIPLLQCASGPRRSGSAAPGRYLSFQTKILLYRNSRPCRQDPPWDRRPPVVLLLPSARSFSATLRGAPAISFCNNRVSSYPLLT